MDMLISIIFFIMFLIIIGVIIYLTYDFINYKENVDKSIELTAIEVNDNFTKVSNNINKTETKLISDISETNNKLNKFKTETNTNQEILNNKIKNITTDIDNFDTSLKKYFTFMDNNQAISNKKIFKHIFESINPDMKLLAKVDVISGMTIRTSENLKDNNNLKICNKNNNCLQINVNNNRFNLTPDNVNDLIINNTSNIPLARFDLNNNSIYFGGSDINSPMFIQNSNLYVNNINMIVKPPNMKYTSENMKDITLVKLSGEDMYKFGENMNSNIDSYYKYMSKTNDFINDNKPLFENAIKTTRNSIQTLSEMSLQVIVNYTLINKIITEQNSANSNIQPIQSVINQLYFKIIPNQELKSGDRIKFEIPYYEIGNVNTINIVDNSKSYFIENMNSLEQNINIQNSIIEPREISALFNILINKDIEKNKPIFFSISGTMLSYKELKERSGISIGTLIKYTNGDSIKKSIDKVSNYLFGASS